MTTPTRPDPRHPDQGPHHPHQPGSGRRRRPRLFTAFRAEHGLLLRAVTTRGRMSAILLLAGISIFAALMVNMSDPWNTLDAGVDYVNSNLSTLIPVATLVVGSATLGTLRDDGSLVYLWLRPVPSWLHVLSAWAATVTVILPLVGAPVLLATAMIHSEPDLLAATLVAGLLGITTYSALAVMIGVRFNRALPLGLVYILIWEGFIASAGDTAAKLSVRGYLRTILSDRVGVDLDLAVVSPTTAIVVPIVVTAVALAYASHRLANTDVP